MGRLRIKNKESVLPFRQTVAYRFILLATLLIIFLLAAVRTIGSMQNGSTTALIISIGLALGAVIGAFYNLEKMRHARIPKKTAQRMRRR